jgi:hypothetical protein
VATRGRVYDLAPELLASPALIALVHEQAMSDAEAQKATDGFRFLVFECRGDDVTCPRFPFLDDHGHAFWKGYTHD